MYMYRTAMDQLRLWKANKKRKPLIIRGARQVGKTWIMKEFGAKEYENVVYMNFDNNERMKMLFEGGLKIERIVTGLELYAGHKINMFLCLKKVILIWPRLLTRTTLIY